MSFDETIEGWFERADAEAYAALVAPIRGGLVAEIGVWKGRSLSAIAEICRTNGNRIVAVDTWEGSAEHAHLDTSRLYEEFWQTVMSRGWAEFIVPYHARSVDVAEAFLRGNKRFDLAFIDGAHDYESVLADLRAWSPLVKPGGVMAGHDYSPGGGASVAEAVDSLFPNVHRPAPGSSVWWAEMP